LLSFGYSIAQEIIQIPYEKSSDTTWEGDEKAFFSKLWDNPVVTNVSVPSMEVFRPPTGEDGVKELADDAATNPQRIAERVAPVMPLSITDALSAIAYVRENAATFKLETDKIGFMGFSAGGAVTMGVAYNYTETNRPDFIVPVYPWTSVYPVQEVPENAPPMLVVCATDDPLGLAIGSIELYTSWHKANKRTAIQMFSKGGHGFGMKKQGLPSDNWIQRFHDWAVAENLTIVPSTN